MSNGGFYGNDATENQPLSSGNSNPFSTQQQAAISQPGGQAQSEFAPPPGPPPRKAATFQESDFVPASERGEQREALEQFEISKAGQESQSDRDMASLQREFPKLDGSLIAAIYGDSQSLSATREMLSELSTDA